MRTGRKAAGFLTFFALLFWYLPAMAMIEGKFQSPESPTYRSHVRLFRYDEKKAAWTYTCSGSLIHRQVILTAAHCLVDDQSGSFEKIQVHFDPIESMEKEVIFAVAQSGLKVHPKYDHLISYSSHDLGLVILSAQAPASYRPLPLLKDPSRLTFPATIHIAGSGISAIFSVVDAKSKKVTTQVNVGERRYTELIADLLDHRFYAPSRLLYIWDFFAEEKPVGGTCAGDSGGPHVAQIDGTSYQVGLTSQANSACDSGRVIATFVSGFLNWIERTLRESFATTASFGFSDTPDAEEWNSRFDLSSTKIPNSAESPHLVCKPTRKGKDIPSRIDIRLLKRLFEVRTAPKKTSRYSYYRLIADFKAIYQDGHQEFYSHASSSPSVFDLFEAYAKFEFQEWPNKLQLLLLKQDNDRGPRLTFLDPNNNEITYRCEQVQPIAGRLQAVNDFYFTATKATEYFSRTACILPPGAELMVTNLGLILNNSAHERVRVSVDESTLKNYPCLGDGPYILRGNYQFESAP